MEILLPSVCDDFIPISYDLLLYLVPVGEKKLYRITTSNISLCH
jgi:hypothetical protein